ncbi:pyridoxal-dependent decarboxylase domain-containing protein 1-like [Daphnia pulicaria]|uniref:pyridoxal-dependent decarboxylase domain-containing protein 1-like n=1 Tax=Daphnia pulicaria TaxID=35523 RepID=UPI001EE9F724|nr:pyridoxal-dependent decarboxylase domain-containing protein 1-like [Daphnia pulicaria]
MEMEEIFDSSVELLDTGEKNDVDKIKEPTLEPVLESEDIDTPSTLLKKDNEVLTKFRAIIAEYLQGEKILDGLDGLTKGVLGSYSLAGYLDFAVPSGKEIIVTKLLQHCCFQLLDLLRVSDGICYAHEEATAAIMPLIQMQLLNLYPKYSTQGYEALYSCPPTIYISPLCIPSLGSVICKKLGFPTSSVKVMKMHGADHLTKMEKSLLEDFAAKRVPLMIIASCGSHHSGQVDNLVAISHLAQRFNAWLHLEGHLINHLSLHDQPKKNLQIADSLHLDLKQLLGVPSLPFVTMYRHCEIALQRAVYLTPSHCSPFSVVPLWFALQSLDSSTISNRFRTAVELSKLLINHLITIPNILIMSHIPKSIKMQVSVESKEVLSDDLGINAPATVTANSNDEDEGVEATKTKTVEELSDLPENSDTSSESDTMNIHDDEELAGREKTKPAALMDCVVPVVVFQYRPSSKEIGECPGNLLDDLNLWLVQVLERACEEIHMDIIDVDESGYALRFSPYDCKSFPSIETLAKFLESLDQQLEILNATVEHKKTLNKIIEVSGGELQLVELPGWAGLGGVRYLPAAWRSDNMEQLPDQGKEEINRINRELVAKLKETDSAFSLGEGRDGLSCVRFGMVVAITDVEALANLVRQTGLDLEASTLALETMAVMIRKGIEEAQAELQRETEEKLWQEGLLRHIPVVGSLVNYFSPPQKTSVKGRCLNLQNGRIEKSEVTIHSLVVEEASVVVEQASEVVEEASEALSSNQETPFVESEETKNAPDE